MIILCPYKNSLKTLEKNKEYYRNHKEKCLQLTKDWGIKHPEKIKEYIKKAHEKKRERYANDLEYRKRVRELSRKSMRRRLDKMYDLRNQIFFEHNNRCDKCGFSNVQALEIHHLFGDNGKDNFHSLKAVVERKVPISILCANCHKILHYSNRKHKLIG